MGYLKNLHGMALIGKTPEETCPEEVKEVWAQALKERGVSVN